MASARAESRLCEEPWEVSWKLGTSQSHVVVTVVAQPALRPAVARRVSVDMDL